MESVGGQDLWTQAMNGLKNLLETVAGALIGVVRLLTRHRLILSCVGLVLTVVLAGAYILVSALHIRPTRSTIAVRVLLPSSGGLLPNQDVTVRGIPVGRVLSVKPRGAG